MLKGEEIMRKVLVFQNDDILDRESLMNMRNYIQKDLKETGVVVIDHRIKYEVVEFDDVILK